MKLTPKIQKAINVAAKAHLGMTRKGDGLPYIVHPFAVAWILASYTDDEDVIIAGFLHDVLEDVDERVYSTEKMEEHFGPRVLSIVRQVSEDKDASMDSKEKKRTWLTRKKSYLDRLEKDTKEALMVSCADKIQNLQSMMEAYVKKGESLWDNFNSPLRERLWFYGQVLEIAKRRLDSKIVVDLEEAYLEAQNLFGPGGNRKIPL